MNKTVGEIAELVGGTVVGDAAVRVTGINAIRHAKPGDLTFLGNKQYVPYLDMTDAAAILVTEDISSNCKPLIRVKNPYMAFVRVIQACELTPQTRHPAGIHASAVIGQNVKLGENVGIDAHVHLADDCVIGNRAVLYAGVYVGHGSTIGDDTVIYPNVTVCDNVTVGARCIFHPGVVLGGDGFGFAPMDDAWFKIPQIGNVIIEDDVEIGANSAVDRATFGSTVIGRGTKIDNLVQIGHNVELGEHCVISGMTGIAGSTIVGDHVIIAAQVGISDHLVIGDGVTIAGRAGVTNSIEPDRIVSGFPARDHIEEKRVLASIHRLPDMLRRLRHLEQNVLELEEELHGKAANHSE